jgi:hypothetical protein
MKRRYALVLLLASVALIIGGLLLGEHKAVFQKAITLCLDCIGIG